MANHNTGGFASNVLKLASASTFSQGLSVLAIPVIARLFSPEAFGIAALFTSISTIVGLIACLRYELAIMLPDSLEEAANVLCLSFMSIVTVTVIIVLVITIFGEALSRLMNAPALSAYIWLIPVTVFLDGTILALTYWSLKTNRFARLSVTRILTSVATQGTKLLLGLAGFLSAGGLIIGDALGKGISATYIGSFALRDMWRLFRSSINWKRILAALRRYRRFPIFSTWSILLNSASQQLPMWVLAVFFTPTVIGFYALVSIVLNGPMNLIGSAVGQAYFQRASESHKDSEGIALMTGEVFNRLVSIAMLPLLLLLLIGNEGFAVIFGSQWTEGGVFLQILCSWIFFQFISSPLSPLFAILEKQNMSLLFDIVLFVSRGIILIVGGSTGSIKMTLVLFTTHGIIYYSFLSYWLLSAAKVPIANVASSFGRSIAYCLPALGLISFAKWGVGFAIEGVFLVGLVGGAFYYFMLFRRDTKLKYQLKVLFHKMKFYGLSKG